MSFKRWFIVLFLCGKISFAQNFCDLRIDFNLDEIDFNSIVFIRGEYTIDSVKYNGVYFCPNSKARIYCNIGKNGKKNGVVIIFKQDGGFFANGEFKADKKSGWWWYGGCCRTYYKRGKEKQTICALF